jgi:hypothetical protein
MSAQCASLLWTASTHRCPHCHHYAPVFEKASAFLSWARSKGVVDVFVGRIDCAANVRVEYHHQVLSSTTSLQDFRFTFTHGSAMRRCNQTCCRAFGQARRHLAHKAKEPPASGQVRCRERQEHKHVAATKRCMYCHSEPWDAASHLLSLRRAGISPPHNRASWRICSSRSVGPISLEQEQQAQ